MAQMVSLGSLLQLTLIDFCDTIITELIGLCDAVNVVIFLRQWCIHDTGMLLQQSCNTIMTIWYDALESVIMKSVLE